MLSARVCSTLNLPPGTCTGCSPSRSVRTKVFALQSGVFHLRRGRVKILPS
jgi:hypothetical protein